jgi:hypothetical protein
MSNNSIKPVRFDIETIIDFASLLCLFFQAKALDIVRAFGLQFSMMKKEGN